MSSEEGGEVWKEQTTLRCVEDYDTPRKTAKLGKQ
jgi:hypothetical protein